MKSDKKTVITYGTYDLFHEGHRRLLERAKALGDHLIVAVTTENYDDSRGKLNVQQSLMQRIDNVKKSGLADEIIIEEYEGQKINDILKYKVDLFAIGSDWVGKFDYIAEYCDLVYLDRTKGVSSTQLRNEGGGILSIGVVGNGRIAKRFVSEARYVSGIDVKAVFGRNETTVAEFGNEFGLSLATTDFDTMLEEVQAVYIATPHATHYEYAKRALTKGVHVLCEKPLTLCVSEAEELYQLAQDNDLVFMEAIKTAYAPGFIRMVAVAMSGLIGNIVDLQASFTMLKDQNSNLRELSKDHDGGSVNELASYPLIAALKILGHDYEDVSFHSYRGNPGEVDLFTKINLRYRHATATLKVGLGAKTEGDLVVSGTTGYIYVPAPWWKTEYFEVRRENPADNKKYFYKFQGDGLRYEIAEFGRLFRQDDSESHLLTKKDSLAIVRIIEKHRKGEAVSVIEHGRSANRIVLSA